MINMYYILGVIGNKYDSMRYIRLSILFIGICGGVSGIIVGSAISQIGTFEIVIYASIFSAVVMLGFMFVSPVMNGLSMSMTGGGTRAIPRWVVATCPVYAIWPQ